MILDLFSMPFFVNALLSVAVMSVLTGIIGSYIVSRKLVFMSGGISHASFGGLGIAWFLGLNPMLGAFVFGVFSALSIEFISSRGKNEKDTAIGILWSVGMAIGILFIFLTPGYQPNLMSYLFGNILVVPRSEIIFGAILTLGIAILFVVFYKPILYVAFDREFALVRRMPVKTVNYLMMVVVALAIIMTMKVAGIILAIAMLTLPPVIASLFCKKLSWMMIVSVVVGVAGSVAGLFLSFLFDTPASATIVFTLGVIYLIVKGLKVLQIFKIEK
ncbi:MAG: metal ABC transporter permease [Bacteroidales bacterium]|nr:metal ABC transporter permease [Bacteroidales bacterium]